MRTINNCALRTIFLAITCTFVVLVGACTEDTSTSGSSSQTDGGTVPDAATTGDAAVSNDAAPDASVEAGPQTRADGTYAIDAWTCGPPGGTPKDIKAYAAGLGITKITYTFAGATGSLVISYDTCDRTVPISSISYPSATTIALTVGGDRTCTVSCAANQCTAGNEPAVSATYTFATAGTAVTYTRVLDAAFLADVSLQKLAGCQENDVETVTLAKQ